MKSMIRRVLAATFLVIAAFLFLFSPILIRSLLYQPFSIPSGAMKPTLLVGDYIFVAKFSYGYTHYSLPYSPRWFSGRIFAAAPERGDVVVFRLPRNDSIDYVMRLVGLPGDRIQMIKGHLHINGEPVKREQVEDFVETEDGRTVRTKRWRETLPNGVSHETLDQVENGHYDNTPVFQVPAGRYFMMGDNRDNSSDSRVPEGVGYVPFENLIGRVAIIFLSNDSARIGTRVH